MSNNWFQFKQFRIEQDGCAMKVTTDACIQGAWTPIAPETRSVLDIGAGTGLLSLMLAQRHADITIDAVEVETTAATQAAKNFDLSPWKERINISCDNIKSVPQTHKKYDLIICNPPFFSNSLQGPDAGRNLARHDSSLNKHDLLAVVQRHLSPTGSFSVLLPSAEHRTFANAAKTYNLYCTHVLEISHRPGAKPKRIISLWKRTIAQEPQIDTLMILDAEGRYTPHFRKLLGDFYLNL